MLRITIFLLLLITLSATAQTHYYVDKSNGSDLNDGLSTSTAWATIQKACDHATPNSIVQIKGGVYNENLQVNVSGTSGNPIVFTNYEDDPVFIDGEGTTGTTLLRITNKSWLHFENLVFRNLERNNAKGIMVETSATGYSRDLIFRNISIHDIKWTNDPLVVPATGQNARGFAVVGRGSGIENLTIQQCKIYNNITGKSEALTLNGNIDDFLIEDCYVHDNTNIGICLAGNYGICADPALDKVRNGIVRNNTCFNNVSLLASSAGIYVDGAQDIIIERNTSYQNGTGIGVGCEKDGNAIYIMVKNNLVYNNHGRGLAVGGYTTLTTGQVLYSTFRNNTLYMNNADFSFASEINISKASHCIFEDNIVYANDQHILLSVEMKLPQEGNLFNYNCLYTSTGDADDLNIYWRELSFDNLFDFQQELGQEVNSYFTDPMFQSVNGQGVVQASVCVNGGNPQLNIYDGELDYAGNPRLSGQTVDIGAFELSPILALPEIIKAKNFIYPNPMDGNKLNFSAEVTNARLQIYDLTGKVICDYPNLSGLSVDLPELAMGMYVYELQQDGSRVSAGKLSVK